MDTLAKLDILAEAARYDAACTSSGADRRAQPGKLGAATPAGCCHSFTPDGRCVTLLKVLPFLSNIANMGVNLVCGVLAFVIGLVVIAIAWIVYRPVLGIILLAAAGALIFFLAKKNKEKAAAVPAEPELPAEPGNPAQ